MLATTTLDIDTCPSIDQLALQALRSGLQGQLLTPDDAGYDAARTPWDLHVRQRPAAVVMAASAADVVAAVNFARQHSLAVAIQATGHGAVVPCDGGLLINTAAMQGVRIDPLARTAWIEAGVKWDAVLEPAQASGLAPLLGSTPDVSAVGYSLGGGMGWITRKYGLAVDSVRAFDIVTADGQLRHVTAASDPDLFWGVRGSAGNFGVVMAIEVELYPVANVYGGNLFFPMSMAREVMRAYSQWITTLPDEWTTSVGLAHLPPLPTLPEPLRGQSVCVVRGCYIGDAEAGAAWLRPIRDLGGILADVFGPMSFRDVAAISNDPLEPISVVGRTEVLRDLSSATIDALIAAARYTPGEPMLFAEVRHVGGAVNRAPADSSAFGHRDIEFILLLGAPVFNPADDPAINQHIRSAAAKIQPYQTGQIYLNFLHDTDVTAARVRAAFAPGTYARLVALKDHFDPTNMFRFNRNIAPSTWRKE